MTEAIRAIRRRDGRLGESRQVGKHVSLGWTSAQKCDLRNYRAGQVIGFHRAVKGIAKHECLEVIRTNEKGVVACNGSGEERTITRKQIQAFDVFERRQIEVARSDRLLLTANRRAQGLRVTNGEIVDVHCVDLHGQIHLADGRILPPDYRYFTHGYAVTAHRSQGKSVDAVVISADGMRKELFYVSASRGRESVTVITSDKEALRDSVGRSTSRQSATELVRKCAVRMERGIHRGLAAARDLARRACMNHPYPVCQILPRQPGKERKHEHGISR